MAIKHTHRVLRIPWLGNAIEAAIEQRDLDTEFRLFHAVGSFDRSMMCCSWYKGAPLCDLRFISARCIAVNEIEDEHSCFHRVIAILANFSLRKINRERDI